MNNNQRPLTPKELMKIRKQQRADEELEKLKKLTVKTYAESRRECTDIKNRLEHASVEDEKEENRHNSQNEENQNDEKHDIEMNIIEATENERRKTLPFKRDNSLEVFELPVDDVFEDGGDERMKVDRARVYTHCFGEDEDETQHHVRKYILIYSFRVLFHSFALTLPTLGITYSICNLRISCSKGMLLQEPDNLAVT